MADKIRNACVALLLLPVAAAHSAEPPAFAKAAGLLGVDGIQSLEYQAAGKYFQFGQAPSPTLPWPAFDVDGYVATLDYTRAAVHAKYHRVQVQEPGRARPFSEQTMDQYSVSGVTWNLAPGPTAIPANLAERNAELWASPQGFIKAARAHAATFASQPDGSLRVRFTLDGKFPFEGVVNAAGEVVRVGSILDSPVLGDTPIEFRYSDYRDFGGVRFPAHIERSIANLPWYDLRVSAVSINGARAFAVPEEIAANPAPSVAKIDVTELAPGLLVFGGGTHNSVIVEQGDGVMVIEAPLSEQRSEAVLAKVRELFPRRPIKGVINTHAHFDHAGGLRTFVAQGIPVITQEQNASYYLRAWRNPRTLGPDQLSRSGRKISPRDFRAFSSAARFEDGRHPIAIHRIAGSGHNDAFALVYLPMDRVLIEADAWTPAPPGAAPPTVINPLWSNLFDNIQRLQLDVERIAPLHGTVHTMDDFRAALAASSPAVASPAR